MRSAEKWFKDLLPNASGFSEVELEDIRAIQRDAMKEMRKRCIDAIDWNLTVAVANVRSIDIDEVLREAGDG